MDINDLKSAWDRYSSQEVDKHRLGKDSIHELLKNQTLNLVDRVNRNIKIGMFLLGAYITYIILDYLYLSVYLSEVIIGEAVVYPKWLEPIDVFSTALIIASYLFFVLRYLKIKRSFSPDTQLKDFLNGILNTLVTYRRMFYLAVIFLLVNIIIGFAAGLYEGIKYNTDTVHGGIQNLTTSKILTIVGVGLGVLIPMVALTFFVLRWGFNKLYGRYLIKVNDTLQELEETFIEE